jgi:RimJ/RimL family protein N-acetyltransferase
MAGPRERPPWARYCVGMDSPDGPASGEVRIRGRRLVLRPLLTAEEIDEEWQAMVTADPMAIAELPDEESFRSRLRRSGRLLDGWLDLAIDLDGVSIGRIQTFVPAGRTLPAGTFELGIGLREDVRGNGYGREAVALLTDWLFEQAAAEVVEAPTDPGNVAMQAVFRRVGWVSAGSLTEYGREWVVYRITRPHWQTRRRDRRSGNVLRRSRAVRREDLPLRFLS